MKKYEEKKLLEENKISLKKLGGLENDEEFSYARENSSEEEFC